MRFIVFLIWAFPALALAAYEPPDPAYAPPSNYYSFPVGSGPSLTTLRTIVTRDYFVFTNQNQTQAVVQPTYEQLKTALGVTDRDPNNSSNILLIYNRASTDADWDSATDWNREHIWPYSRLGLGSGGPSDGHRGPASDLFNLRPANPTINSTRGNLNFGSVGSTGTYGVNGSYWFPGNADKGDVARSMFYMETMYSALKIVNGSNPDDEELGDLQSLLKWHYTDGVDNFERRRNDVIFDNYQHNRNPYIDHPEYVWAIFGGGNNNSQLSVATQTAGASSANVTLGTIIIGASFGTQAVTLSKSGSMPTTFDVSLGGNANVVGSANNVYASPGQTFDYSNQSRSIVVGLTNIATPGAKTGTVTIDNTDLTTGSAGLGSADGNDTINVSGTVLNHANASFLASDTNSLTLNFGSIDAGAGVQQLPFSIRNLATTVGFTAPLDLLSITGPASSVLTTNLATFTNLPEGEMNSFLASFDTANAGNYSRTLMLNLSDRVTIAGATTQQLTLNLIGSVLPLVLGDFDGNRERNAADLSAMLKALTDLDAYQASRNFSLNQLRAIGDYNGDEMVTNLDLQFFINSLSSPSPVPEPAAFALVCIAAPALAGLARKRKKTVNCRHELAQSI